MNSSGRIAFVIPCARGPRGAVSPSKIVSLPWPVAWSDDRSRTTYENAVYTARLLNTDRVTSVVIVTHAWHLPRALWAFERVGLKPLPWPAPRTFIRLRRVDDFLPSIAALHDSSFALHEMIGGAYYRLRY